MGVWTISAEAGTGGERVAAALAELSGAELLDRDGLVRIARQLDPELGDVSDIEERVGGRLSALALGLAVTGGAGGAFEELRLRRTLAGLSAAVLREATRCRSVIVAPGAFVPLGDHPGAIHVRLWAPFAWRVESYARDHVVDRHCAERAVKHDDHLKRAWVKTLYHVDLDDPRHFSFVVDASRTSPEPIARALLAAAGREPVTATPA
jgi:cytidylate kinase